MPEANVVLQFQVIMLDDGRVGVQGVPPDLLAQKVGLIGILELAKKSVVDFVPAQTPAIVVAREAPAVPQELNGKHPPLRRI